MRKFLLAFQFLTIFPVKIASPVSNAEITGSAAFFPVVGLLQGIVVAGTAFVSGIALPANLSVAVVLLALVFASGGFHLDGLADTVDALSAKSVGSPEQDRKVRLAVMKAGAAGPMGITAIVFALALKYLALTDIEHLSSPLYYATLVLLPVIPKWTMVISMFLAQPAREEGLGHLFITGTGAKEAATSTVTLVILCALHLSFSGRFGAVYPPLFYVALFSVLYAMCRGGVHLFERKLGGLTGDTFGAISEASEVIFLLMVILWSRLSI